MDFSEKEIAKFIDIIVKNNIKLEFDKPEDFLKCISQLTTQFEKKIDLNRFNNTCLLKLEEYSLTDSMKRISTGYCYPFRFFDYCPIDNLVDCINITIKIFRQIGLEEGVFDFMSQYYIMYPGEGGDKKRHERLYLWTNPIIIDRTSSEQREYVFQSLYVDKTHLNFLSSTNNDVRLNYIGFNRKNLIDKYGIKIEKNDFFQKQPCIHYKDYYKINEVIDNLESILDNENINMQVVPGKAESIAFETMILAKNYYSEIKKLVSSEIIEETQAEKALSMDVEKYYNIIFKYKWDKKDKLEVKIYFLEDCVGK